MSVRPLALVAEDDPDIRALVSIRIAGLGFEVLAAANGDEALALALRHAPRIAVLDVCMPPGPDGLEVARRIRDSGVCPETAVIILTARVQTEDRAAAAQAGAVAYVQKPFSPGDLHDAVALAAGGGPGS